MMTEKRTEQDRRSYIRIKDRILLGFTSISQGDFEKIIRGYHDGLDTPWAAYVHPYLIQNAQSKIKKLKESNDTLAAVLEIMDQKLNLILNLLSEDRDDTSNLRPKAVDLSAAGIAFRTSHDIEEGQILELDIGLLPQRLFIRCYGRVLRIEDDKSGKKKLGVEFIWITEDDEDRLIEHIFHRQIILLRMRRKKREAAETSSASE